MKLAFRESGSGPPLLILHGLFGSSANWRGIARVLSERYRVLTLDLRNHGDSPWADDMTYEALAEDVSEFLEDQSLKACHVIGHSMGGKTAMILSLTQPQRVKSLIVADIAPVIYHHSHNELIEQMMALPLDDLRSRTDADQHLSKDIPEASLRQFLLQNLTREGDGYRWRINLQSLKDSMSLLTGFPEQPDNVTYNGACLFLRGSRSDYIRLPEMTTAIHRLFPNAVFKTIDDAGHWLHAEQPSAFLEDVSVFLNDT